MDSSRSSLPNVDRANSTLFKRYLDEQHKSVVKSTNYPSLSRPINTSIQITHTHRQHQQQQQQQQNETYITPKSNNNNSNQQVMIKRKFSTGRKPSGDTSKQRVSHTSRFMKRFQRQHKNGETITNVQKHDGGRARFEFHDPPSTIKPVRTDQDTRFDPNSSNRLSNSSSTSSSQKLAIDSSELKRLRDALQRFSSDLDAVSQRIHTNREAAAAPQEVERLMSLNLVETKDEPEIKSEEILTTNDNQSTVPMTV
ncbi:unnamed protein product [Adineta steineri]|uniref:Uncharacterized protein n=1 Tax=Adineta steineri TaxID=433720 RepID=A0A814STB1_9BILA|nr:unnamed protein product [Adineta steineri]